MRMNYLNEPSAKISDWQQVGKLWPHKTKADAFSGRFGVQTKNAKGERVEIFSELTIKADDPVMVRLSGFKAPKAPTHLIYMLKESPKK